MVSQNKKLKEDTGILKWKQPEIKLIKMIC